MIALGLSAADQAAFHRALCTSHQIRVVVQLLNLTHGVVATVTDRLLEGSVSVDTSADPTTDSVRTLSMVLLDPARSMGLDSADPASGGAWADNMVRVQYGVHVDELDRWIWVPVFTGPVTRTARNDALVTVDAAGKDRLAQGALWRAVTYGRGAAKTSIIAQMLLDAGESRTYMSIPAQAAKLPKPLALNQLSVPWGEAQALARGMTQQLFYDGRGIARQRSWPGSSTWTFRGGPGGTLMSRPTVDFSDAERNTVWVKGAKPAGATRAIEVIKYAPGTHPMAPGKLGRNGRGRYLPEVIEDDTITSNVAAETLAVAKINELTREQYSVAFDALPIPHLEEGDLVTVVTDEFSSAFRLTSYTLPLTTGVMSVGYTRVASRPEVALSTTGAAAADRLNRMRVQVASRVSDQQRARARYLAARKAGRRGRKARQALLRARAATARSRARLRSAKHAVQRSKWTSPW